MSVRIKATCISKTQAIGSGEVKLEPVINNSKENKQFWEYTPSGSITISIDNNKAFDAFEVGNEYYVDFTHV